MTAVLDTTMVEGARWSLAATCPRMACLHLNGETPAEPDDGARGYQLRGHLWEQHALAELQERYPGHEIRCQEQVEWEHGVIHADFYVPHVFLVVEHKSRRNLDPQDRDWLQLAGQIVKHPDAQIGELWITDPVQPLNRRRLPFTPSDAWIDRVRDVEKQLARRHVQMPDRICQHPADARQHHCRFPAPCFADWTPPAPGELDQHAQILVQQLHHAERDLAAGRGGPREALEEHRNKLRQELAGRLESGRDYVVKVSGGTIRVRRTEVAGRVTFDWKSAVNAGALTAEAAAPFLKTGEPSDRWTVKADGDIPDPASDDDEYPFD